MSKIALSIVLLMVGVSFVASQIAIPHRPLGFPVGSNDAPVVIEVFIDLLCSDSKAGYPVIRNVQQYYGNDKVKLIVHFSPIVSYRNAFHVDLGTYVVAKYANASAAFDYIDAAFANQSLFWDTPTASMTGNQVNALIGQLAASSGLVSVDTMLTGLADSTLRDALYTSVLYSITRGVLNHPWFLVNNVAVGADASWQVEDWIKVLDPLFTPGIVRGFPYRAGDCPSGETLCTYLPGKTQCCLPGQMCIPNVGCRC